MGSAILHLLQASPCQIQDGPREVPIAMLSTMRQAPKVFQKRLPFETRIKASEQFQLILSSLCMLLVYTAGWLSTCAQGNVKPLQKRRKQMRKPIPQGELEIGEWVLAMHFVTQERRLCKRTF